MLLREKYIPKTIAIFICILVIGLGVRVIISPMAIFPDAYWGFHVLRTMEHGGGFNLNVRPDPSNINNNLSDFLTWWSPGQYLIPYFFKAIFGINTGQASAATVMIFNVLGLTGFYFFFKKVGFSPFVAAISIGIIACQQEFLIPYVFYNGGEVLIFGFAGWFLWGCAAIDKRGIRLVLFLFASGLLGFFFKSSFLWVYLAGCLYLWLKLSSGQNTIGDWLKKGIWIGMPAFLSLAVIYLCYLSKGPNPASITLGIKPTWVALGFPMASPLLSGFSVDDIFGGLISGNGLGPSNQFWTSLILVISTVLSVLLVITIIRRGPGKKYSLLVIVFYLVAIVFFGYSFLMQANISYEVRHLRLIGLIIIPGGVYMVLRSNLAFKTIFLLFCFIIAYATYSALMPNYQKNTEISGRGSSGFAQQNIDQVSLDHITSLDKRNKNAIFVFINPELGLEANNNRVITLRPVVSDLDPADYVSYVHHGHAGPLYILLPSNYMGPQANLILECFPDYKEFETEILSNDYVLFSAK
ncbi:hypothetical protein AB6735_11625 [Mucilaginibacter sp. RCC_168]|uniref:hypothetical protein n=1 Tax=Mucilaginibacter sp. RCC_168 TaxID=3239221 RepID=UPI00352507CF